MDKETAGCPRHTFFSITLVKLGNTVALCAMSWLLFFDGKCKYLVGEVLVWVQIFKNYFIVFKIKCLKNADVLQTGSDYHVEKGPVTHLFLN